MNNAFEKFGKFVIVLLMSAALGLLIAFPIMWSWNYTMPGIFELPTITWGQAWCLSFLSSRFVKSFLFESPPKKGEQQ
jgi:hypothetical protein